MATQSVSIDTVTCNHLVVERQFDVRSGIDGAPHTCSPIMEMSTSSPHVEHFMAGMKLDALPAIFAVIFLSDSCPSGHLLLLSSGSDGFLSVCCYV